MLVTLLIYLLLSNAVSLRRDKSILFSRLVSTSFLSIAFFVYKNLCYVALEKGIGIYGGLFNVTILTQSFSIFILLVSAVILTLTSFYPRKGYINLQIKKILAYITLNKLVFFKTISLFFCFSNGLIVYITGSKFFLLAFLMSFIPLLILILDSRKEKTKISVVMFTLIAVFIATLKVFNIFIWDYPVLLCTVGFIFTNVFILHSFIIINENNNGLNKTKQIFSPLMKYLTVPIFILLKSLDVFIFPSLPIDSVIVTYLEPLKSDWAYIQAQQNCRTHREAIQKVSPEFYSGQIAWTELSRSKQIRIQKSYAKLVDFEIIKVDRLVTLGRRAEDSNMRNIILDLGNRIGDITNS